MPGKLNTVSSLKRWINGWSSWSHKLQTLDLRDHLGSQPPWKYGSAHSISSLIFEQFWGFKYISAHLGSERNIYIIHGDLTSLSPISYGRFPWPAWELKGGNVGPVKLPYTTKPSSKKNNDARMQRQKAHLCISVPTMPPMHSWNRSAGKVVFFVAVNVFL